MIKENIEEKELEETEKNEEFEEEEKQTQETPKEKKKEEKRRIGVLYINSMKNNTILMLTDMAGNTLSRASGGQTTKQARLKASPTVAIFSANKIGEDAKEYGITDLYVRVRGETGGTSSSSVAHAVIKSLGRSGFKILSIMDTTRIPRGGPKKPGGRRGRRV